MRKLHVSNNKCVVTRVTKKMIQEGYREKKFDQAFFCGITIDVALVSLYGFV